MKKLKLFLILILLILPLNIKAEEQILNLDCPTISAQDQIINCTITSTTNIKGLKLNFSLPEDITYNDTVINNNWNNHYSNQDGLVLTTTKEENLNTSITFKTSKTIEINKEYNITLTNIEASDTNHNLLNINTITKTIKIVSNDNTLSKLTITNGTLSPSFNKDTTNYTTTINKETTTISATPTNSNAKVSGDIGEKKLNYGSNIFKIIVTSEFGTIKTYTITVIRPMPEVKDDKETTTQKPNNNTTTETTPNIKLNSDASLSSLIVENYKIDFKKDTYLYELKVPNSITNVNINVTPSNSKATVKIDKPNTLEVGINVITITVTAEDGTICNYVINITREEKEIIKEDITKEDLSEEDLTKNISTPLVNNLTIGLVVALILIILIIISFTKKRILKQEK